MEWSWFCSRLLIFVLFWLCGLCCRYGVGCNRFWLECFCSGFVWFFSVLIGMCRSWVLVGLLCSGSNVVYLLWFFFVDSWVLVWFGLVWCRWLCGIVVSWCCWWCMCLCVWFCFLVWVCGLVCLVCVCGVCCGWWVVCVCCSWIEVVFCCWRSCCCLLCWLVFVWWWCFWGVVLCGIGSVVFCLVVGVCLVGRCGSLDLYCGSLGFVCLGLLWLVGGYCLCLCVYWWLVWCGCCVLFSLCWWWGFGFLDVGWFGCLLWWCVVVVGCGIWIVCVCSVFVGCVFGWVIWMGCGCWCFNIVIYWLLWRWVGLLLFLYWWGCVDGGWLVLVVGVGLCWCYVFRRLRLGIVVLLVVVFNSFGRLVVWLGSGWSCLCLNRVCLVRCWSCIGFGCSLVGLVWFGWLLLWLVVYSWWICCWLVFVVLVLCCLLVCRILCLVLGFVGIVVVLVVYSFVLVGLVLILLCWWFGSMWL